MYAFEFVRIQGALEELSTTARAALKQRLERGKEDPRCPLLDDVGQCRVYESRPMICRSHGLPISVGDPPKRDVCPLNFGAGPTPDEMSAEDVLNVNSVNAIMAVLDHVESDGKGQRIDLIEGLRRHLGDD